MDPRVEGGGRGGRRRRGGGEGGESGEETRLEDVASALNIFHACSLPPTVDAGE